MIYRFAKEICDAIVAKCLTGRPKTVEKAQAVFMLWVELEAVDVFLVFFFFSSRSFIYRFLNVELIGIRNGFYTVIKDLL